MEDNQTSYLEKKEERESRKEQELLRRERGRSLRTFTKYSIVAVVVLVAGYGAYLLLQDATPKTEDQSVAIPIMDATHIEIGSQLPEYTSNPPTSGPHYVQTARSGFREEEIPDQHIIHNLEHGDIWISYHPRVGDEVIEELKQFVGVKVIITSREANGSDIALAAWGRLDIFDIEDGTVPVERIKDFIKRYTNRGPEQVPGASGGV